MGKNKLFLGDSLVNTEKSIVDGRFVDIDGEKYYQIKNYHEMPDFFMSIVSDSDHWMFISSNGSLSAGRKNRDNALFPYYTVDKIHDYKNISGSATYFLVKKKNKTYLWQPFSDESRKIYKISRNLYKSSYGNKVIFEEVNDDLGLSFRYGWYNSEKFGFVKKSSVINHGKKILKFEVLDGIKNILPFGIGYDFQNEYSNLLDAYKKNEQLEDSSVGLFTLSSIPIDRAEPSEALRATVVWSVGANDYQILISDRQVENFRNGLEVISEHEIKASRGAYYINFNLQLRSNDFNEWFTIAELNLGTTDVSNLNYLIKTNKKIEHLINDDIQRGTENLKKMVSSADGFQITNTDLCYVRHYSNTLFNIMRGGIFTNQYTVEAEDFKKYLWQINKLKSKEYNGWLNDLPTEFSYINLLSLAKETGDADLIRIAYEYLPLTFSRRHGDPSRPWNMFSIETKSIDGKANYNYEGNWRDIFQNWEALCYSYPEFTEGIISKFVNASTIDGYNPYRIMREGIDWETPDPNDPWSYIGYWGDHQIIYLQKLLEISNHFHPGILDDLLISEIFTYANVPYQIKSYEEIKQNPKNTVVFNEDLNKRIKNERVHLGADASLVKNKADEQTFKVNLTEKILVTLLSKLSNFIPEAGIWMNTQRPEWNDANNALVGNGTSMVTVYYLRRFLKFWEKRFSGILNNEVSVSEEVASLFNSIHEFLKGNLHLTQKGFTDKDRKRFADYMGQAHWKYRNEIYNFSFSGEKSQLKAEVLMSFTQMALKYIDQSISANKRPDGLYHAYNLISFNEDQITVRNLYEMLEGQVAVLSSGFLSSKESLEVLNNLKKSDIYRPDQYSYMLYPFRKLARFIEKNNIPKKQVENSRLLKKLISDKETSIIKKDIEGRYHFNGTFRNAEALEKALDKLRIGSYSHLIEIEKENILNIYEGIFDHQSFTGRSGTFYGYEGLGSIYWHMVSKLLLATQECFFAAMSSGSDHYIVGSLKDHYYEIKAGIGLYKSPNLYGGFPTDAYSHTPSNSGVKQPGLTGQVKEDIISRMSELGIIIKEGKIKFQSDLLNDEEILEKEKQFEYYSISGDKHSIHLNKNQIGFTFCQTPIIYTFSDEDKISVYFQNGKNEEIKSNVLRKDLSSMIFSRNKEINLVEVTIKQNNNVS